MKIATTPTAGTDDSTTVAQLRQLVARFVAEREWERYHDPKNLSMALAIEAAELMEHFQWLRSDELDTVLQEPKIRAEIREELADVLAFTLALANRLGLDVSTALTDKMAKNAAKYPADQFRGSYRKPAAP